MIRTLVAAVIAFTTWAVPPPAQSEVCPYAYADSFNTDQAITDAYAHSLVVADLSKSYLYSVLMYTNNEFGNRGLGFVQGFEPDGGALLQYRFPVPGPGRIRSGHLSFYLWPMEHPTRLRMRLSVSCLDAGGIFTSSLTQSGRFDMTMVFPDPCSRAEIVFRGSDLILDDLKLCLDDVTPVRPTTWGRLKILYR